jgi:hypothetical protein
MSYLTNIIRLFVKNEKKVLGRWNIDYCNQKINSKIDLSNEDHCGPCGQYILNKSLNKSLNKNYVKNDNDDSKKSKIKITNE